jgi:hypothetical protein
VRIEDDRSAVLKQILARHVFQQRRLTGSRLADYVDLGEPISFLDAEYPVIVAGIDATYQREPLHPAILIQIANLRRRAGMPGFAAPRMNGEAICF